MYWPNLKHYVSSNNIIAMVTIPVDRVVIYAGVLHVHEMIQLSIKYSGDPIYATRKVMGMEVKGQQLSAAALISLRLSKHKINPFCMQNSLKNAL